MGSVWARRKDQDNEGKGPTAEDNIRNSKKAVGDRIIVALCKERNISEQMFLRRGWRFGVIESYGSKRYTSLSGRLPS